MLVAHSVFRSRPDRRAETVAALVAMQHATREVDTGCLNYAFMVDLEDDCLFTCVEEWRDAPALEAHLASPHMAALDEALARTAAGPARIRVFEATPTEVP